jgi:hypothetical protein
MKALKAYSRLMQTSSPHAAVHFCKQSIDKCVMFIFNVIEMSLPNICYRVIVV